MDLSCEVSKRKSKQWQCPRWESEARSVWIEDFSGCCLLCVCVFFLGRRDSIWWMVGWVREEGGEGWVSLSTLRSL